MEEEVQLILMNHQLTMGEEAQPIQMAQGGIQLILMDQGGIQHNLAKDEEVEPKTPWILPTEGKLQLIPTACMDSFLMEVSRRGQQSSLLSKHVVLPRLTLLASLIPMLFLYMESNNKRLK